MFRKRRPSAPDPIPEAGADWTPATAEESAVESIRAWVDSGSELAEIVDQAPTYDANPDTAHYLRQRSREAAVAEIDAEHARRRAAIDAEDRHRRAGAAREERAIGEAEADADEAAADLRMDRAYERDFSPVVAARALAASARRWRGYDLGYALVGSGLSAAGIGATLNVATELPLLGCAGLAVAAEAVMTVRVVDLIGRLARLEDQDRTEAPARPAAADGDDGDASPAPRRDGTRTHLMVQAGALLSLSVLANLVGALMGAGFLGVVGMCGAILAALAGIGSHASSRAAAATISGNMAAWRGAAWDATRAELRRRASGTYIPDLGEAEAAPAGGTENAPAATSAEDAETAAAETLMHMSARDKAIAAHLIAGDAEMMDEIMEARTASLLAEDPVPDDTSALGGTEAAEGGGTDLADAPEAPAQPDADPAAGGIPDRVVTPPHNAPEGGHAADWSPRPEDGVTGGGQAEATGETGAESTPDTEGWSRRENGGADALTNRNRGRSESARQRVWGYYATNPGAAVNRAAAELGMSRNTVRKYKP